MAYVVIGACLAPTVNVTRLVATLLAFFFAVGLAAHSLDELNGRPLGTHIPAGALVAVTVVGLAAAVALGIAGVSRVGWALVPFLVLGPLLVVAYNFELFGGVIHNDAGFALGMGVLSGVRRLRGSDRPSGGQSGDRCRGGLCAFGRAAPTRAPGHGSSAAAAPRWEVRSRWRAVR